MDWAYISIYFIDKFIYFRNYAIMKFLYTVV